MAHGFLFAVAPFGRHPLLPRLSRIQTAEIDLIVRSVRGKQNKKINPYCRFASMSCLGWGAVI